MKNSLVGIAVFSCFAAVAAMAQQEAQAPCPVENAPKGWIDYINRAYGFCFSYPPVYTPVAEPWLEKYTGDPTRSQALHKAAEEGRLLRLQHKKFDDAEIAVLLGTTRFDLHSLIKQAPMGSESPPDPIKVGRYRFYYYGPGGGGVCYPDQYFFNLRGKTLDIDFGGPCVRDKTPTPETKKIERQLLESFRTF